MIDVRQLTYFVAVVEAKSFTGASEVLHIAQPALSQHIQRLEYEFGQQLLIRHSRGIVPTPAGVRLVEHAREILSAVQAAKDDIRNFEEEPESQIRIGMPRSLIDAFALDLLEEWAKEHPKVQLLFIEQPSNTLNEWLSMGRLDLAVSSFPSEGSKLAAEPLVQDKFCAILPRKDERPDLTQIRFPDLAATPLILTSAGNVSRQLIEMTAKYTSVQLNVAHEIDSANLALKMVQAGIGGTIQPYLAARNVAGQPWADVRLIVAPSITRRLHMIRASRRSMPGYMIAFRSMIRQRMCRLAAEYPDLVELDIGAADSTAAPGPAPHADSDGED